MDLKKSYHGAIRVRAVVWLVGLSLAQGSAFPGEATSQPPPSPTKEQKVDEAAIRALIKQLGDDSFDKREAADKRLAAIGEPALKLLEKAAKDDPDMEVRFRAAELVRGIGRSFLREVRRYEGHAGEPQQKATRVVASPDGRRAVSAGSGMLRYGDVDTGKEILAFGPTATPSYWALAISTDGKRVIAGGEDNLAQVFELPSGKRLQQFPHAASVRAAPIVGDGKRAITAAWDQSIHLWDVETGNEVRTFDNVGESARGMAISPDGKTLATASFRVIDGGPGTVRLWDIATGKMVRGLEGHTENPSSVAFSPDGKTLASCGTEGTLRLWDVATGKELKQFQQGAHRMEYTAFTPDGRRLMAVGGTANPTLRVWDIASGKLVVASEEVGGGILGVAALRDNNRCLTASRDGIIRLWQWKR